MTQILYREGAYQFLLTEEFDVRLLTPILCNIMDKVQSDWDDYDEFYHSLRLIEAVRQAPEMQMEFHCLQKDGAHVGIAAVTKGRIDPAVFFRRPVELRDAADRIVMFNSFHIASEGRGVGEHWLRDVILPHYGGQGYAALYVKSSHTRALPLYARLGEEIGSYTLPSDNGVRQRLGKIFRITL